MTSPAGEAVVGAATGAVNTVTGLLPGADAANAVVDAVTAIRRWVSDRHNAVRVAWFVAGYALIIAGAYRIARPAIDPVIETAKKVIT